MCVSEFAPTIRVSLPPTGLDGSRVCSLKSANAKLTEELQACNRTKQQTNQALNALVLRSQADKHAFEETIRRLEQTNHQSTTALEHTQAALDTLTKRVSSREAQCLEDGVDQLPPAPPNHPSGGAAKRHRPGNKNRQLTGGLDTPRNVSRWVTSAKSSLEKFTPAQLERVISKMHAEYKAKSFTDDGLVIALEQMYIMDPVKLKTFMPEQFLEAEAKAAQQELADEIQAHWSIGRCLSMKYRNMLSRDQYDHLNKNLSESFESGSFQRISSRNGVRFPKLHTRHALETAWTKSGRNQSLPPGTPGWVYKWTTGNSLETISVRPSNMVYSLLTEPQQE